MSRGFAFVYSIALGISLLISGAALRVCPETLIPGAHAQTGGLDPAKISEFQTKLEIAQRTQADLSLRVSCLNQRDIQLVAQRNDQERRLGQLRTEENKLASEVNRLEAAYGGFAREFERQQGELRGFRRHAQDLWARKRQQEHALQTCKAEPFIPNFLCDASYGLLELTGDIKNYDGAIAAAETRERIAQDSANFARQKLEQSRREFDSAKAQANGLAADIHRTEREISATKSALSTLRAEIQPYQILIDQFAGALAEAKEVDLADARARALRKLSGIASNIDAATVHSVAAVRRAEEAFGAGWMKSCASG